MKKKISVSTALVLILFAVLLTFQITYSFVEMEYQEKVNTLTKTQSDFSKLAQADLLIRENFYAYPDEESVEDGLIEGYISSLNDPYSRYLTPQEYELYKKENGESGIGIGVRFTYDSKKKETVVYTVYPSSPADQSGLKSGDVLYQVDGKLASEMGFYDTIRAISGQEGTQVEISVKRRLAAQVLDMEFTVTRKEVQVSTVAYEILQDNVGYIQIFDFTAGTAEEFSNALYELGSSGVDGFIFDVRNTSGTDIAVCCEMLDQLLPKGVLVKTVDRNGKQNVIRSDDNYLNLPMCVLINSGSACAAELFACALKDYEAAYLIGETTYGKAVVQTVVEMDDGSALVLSNLTFTPPKSPTFEKVGVEPDLPCELETVNLYLISHEEDNQLQEAISTLGV